MSEFRQGNDVILFLEFGLMFHLHNIKIKFPCVHKWAGAVLTME
jgi:hypothetical protein